MLTKQPFVRNFITCADDLLHPLLTLYLIRPSSCTSTLRSLGAYVVVAAANDYDNCCVFGLFGCQLM